MLTERPVFVVSFAYGFELWSLSIPARDQETAERKCLLKYPQAVITHTYQRTAGERPRLAA